MGCKCLVALQLKVPHHFIERFASGRARRVEDPGAFGAAPTTAFFDPNERACCRHYRRTTKSRVRIFCAIFLSAPFLNMQPHSVHLSGPPQESAQRSVSIPQKQIQRPESVVPPCTFGSKHAQTADKSPPRLTGASDSAPYIGPVQSSFAKSYHLVTVCNFE
jgi:hypothetical protein